MNQSILIIHYTLGLCPGSPSEVSSLPSSLLPCLLSSLPRYLPGFWFHPAGTLFVQAWDTMCLFGLRLLHLGLSNSGSNICYLTTDLCIPQSGASSRQTHLSLANTYYPKGLILMHHLCQITFFPEGKRMGRNKEKEQHRHPCLVTSLSEAEMKNLRKQPCL